MATIEAPGEKIAVGDLVYEAEGHFTEIVDYGMSLEESMSGKPLPAAGIKLDVAFEGTVTGLLEGTFSGVDYLYTRADGVDELHIHGCLITTDGARIAVFATGTVSANESGHVRLFEHVRLHTNFERYQWVNGLAVRGEGTIDPGAGTLQVRACAA